MQLSLSLLRSFFLVSFFYDLCYMFPWRALDQKYYYYYFRDLVSTRILFYMSASLVARVKIGNILRRDNEDVVN